MTLIAISVAIWYVLKQCVRFRVAYRPVAGVPPLDTSGSASSCHCPNGRNHSWLSKELFARLKHIANTQVGYSDPECFDNLVA
ncbi:hypothetical protein L209DRAFT_538852 [Thermothelomyces heterothallicus CBS 203.75]